MISELIIKLANEGSLAPNWEEVGNASTTVRRVDALFPDAPAGDPTRLLLVAEVESADSNSLAKFVRDLFSLKAVEYAHLPAKRDLLSSQ